MIDLTETEKWIIRIIQDDMPVAEQPYKVIADHLGISEAEVIAKIKEFRKKGYIRRFGATLRHREAGISANGMGIWIVPKEDAERIGKIMASFKEVTHCYERPTFPDWPYNLYTMIHGKTREDCEAVAKKISEAIGIQDYKLLYSTKEFKKTSMRYFEDEEDKHEIF
ncbi:MAG: Lrp/AsnC family transcriptional regulator [Nitrospirae bacterium]|nr:Lrp/AsnC family transcriptional regulator [Nitrospirota bacterium]